MWKSLNSCSLYDFMCHLSTWSYWWCIMGTQLNLLLFIASMILFHSWSKSSDLRQVLWNLLLWSINRCEILRMHLLCISARRTLFLVSLWYYGGRHRWHWWHHHHRGLRRLNCVLLVWRHHLQEWVMVMLCSALLMSDVYCLLLLVLATISWVGCIQRLLRISVHWWTSENLYDVLLLGCRRHDGQRRHFLHLACRFKLNTFWL